MDIFGEPQELDEELKSHVYDGTLGKMIHHPLVIQVVYHEAMNGWLNQMLKKKRELLDEYLSVGNYSGYVFIHERPYRANALLHIVDQVKSEDYWQLVHNVYIDTENVYESFDVWDDLLRSTIPIPDSMKPTNVPEIVNVYRGFKHEDSMLSFSWTLDHEKAVWFANRLHDKRAEGELPRVVSATVKRSDIIMHLTNRGEDEVVILPENVTVVDVKPC